MCFRLLHNDNARFGNVMSDGFAADHPMFLNPEFRCSNFDCATCLGLKMARTFTEGCYHAQHDEASLEKSISKSLFC